jgi:hypothetical protein
MREELKQTGRIMFEGSEATKFWVRALDMEAEVESVRVHMADHPADFASVPIISEYEIDEQFTFVYVVVPWVDKLGIRGGSGLVYYTSPERLNEVTEKRDKFAADIVKNLKAKPLIKVIDDKQERGRML